MATIPYIIFDENTDYDAVLVTTKLLFSELKANNQCGCNSKLDKSLCNTLGYIYAADFFKAKPDQINYEEAVETAYLSLTCNC